MHIDSKLIHAGRSSAASPRHSVNPPLVRASTLVFPTLAEFKASYDGITFESPKYGRSGTSTVFELQAAMALVSSAETCIATASGLSAIAAVLGAHSAPGKHLLVFSGVYGPTRTLCEKELRAQGCEVEFFDSAADLAGRIRPHTSLVFVEVPSSLTMQMLDIRQVCISAHENRVPVACDSTWGTPLFFDAHALGIDISIHAATKYINGHSDVMLGLITGSYASLASLRIWCDRYGSHAAPDACWLALRGLRTLRVRMQRHEASALAVAKWLQRQPAVKRVLFPALADDPGHALWTDQFTGGAGPFTFELQRCPETAFERFIDGLRLFNIGTSWGGFESLVMPAIPHHLRSLTIQPDDGRMVRLHIGLEDAADLCGDLEQALSGAMGTTASFPALDSVTTNHRP
jgi:cystathionine beta-lyase